MANKRKVLTLDDRVSVIKLLDSGKSARQIALQYGCGRTQISKINTDREGIMKEWESGGRSDQKYVKRRKTLYEDLNTLVWEWFCKARSKNLPVSGRLIQEKALMMSVTMNHDDFTASNGWLESWQKRYGVKLGVLAGESAEVPEDVVEDWAKRLPDLTKDYALKDIFNADETGLYYRALPSRSMVVKSDPRRGLKTAKERITALIAASATGEKLKPLVIGKSVKPRCFAGMELSLLPVTYRANKRAWMTSALWKEWLERLNSQMKNQKRKILLFVDNCSAHPNIELTNIKLMFLPPNTTSRLQPCDAGIIAAIKASYRKRLLRHVLSRMDECHNASELSKKITLKDAVSWLTLAWTALDPTCIKRCFAKCGFLDAHLAPIDEPEEINEDDLPLAQLMGDTPWNDYLTMDDNTTTTADIYGDWEAQLLARAAGAEVESEESGEEEEEGVATYMTMKEALVQVNHIIDACYHAQQPELIETCSKLQAQITDYRLLMAGQRTQQSIQDFFMS